MQPIDLNKKVAHLWLAPLAPVSENKTKQARKTFALAVISLKNQRCVQLLELAPVGSSRFREMADHGNPRISFRAPSKVHKQLVDRAQKQHVEPSEWVRLQISRLLDESLGHEERLESQVEALRDAVANLTNIVKESIGSQAKVERLCAAAVASSALLMDDKTISRSEMEARLGAHIRIAVTAASTVLTIRDSATAPVASAAARPTN